MKNKPKSRLAQVRDPHRNACAAKKVLNLVRVSRTRPCTAHSHAFWTWVLNLLWAVAMAHEKIGQISLSYKSNLRPCVINCAFNHQAKVLLIMIATLFTNYRIISSQLSNRKQIMSSSIISG